MKVVKKIFVGSILLLLAITPLIASARTDENKQNLSMNDEKGFLGTVRIVHQPMLWHYREHHGMDVISYTPPPTFDYNFTEMENGSVALNFYVTIEHKLNDPGIVRYFASWLFPYNFRFTCVKNFWIYDPSGSDIYSIEYQEPCTDFEHFQIYNITATGNYFETNGKNVTLQFWLWGYPGVTPVRSIQTIISFLPDVFQNFLSPYCDPLPYIPITIHPI